MANATPAIKQKEPAIRKVYNPEGQEHDVLKHVYDRYWRMKDYRAQYEGDWERWEKQWDTYRPPKDVDDWRSNIYIPLTTSIIEAQLSEMIEHLPMPWAVERGPKDTPKAPVVNAMFSSSWAIAKSDVSLFDILKDKLILGTGLGQEYYKRDKRIIKNDKGEDTPILEFDDCYLEPVRIWDLWVDETARSFSTIYPAQDALRRYIMDYDDFRDFFQGEWDPMGNAQYVKPGGDTNYYEFYKPPDRIEHSRQVEVLWYWNKPDDMLCIVANDVNVYMKPNPYKHKQLPFIRAIDIRKTHQFYGKGEAALLDSLQEETNVLRRMTIDRSHLDIDKPILVSDTLTIEDEDTTARPHGVIQVGDVNGAKVMEYGDIPASVFRQLELLNDDKVRVTGMDERQQSVAGSSTATEAAILKEATLKRINMKLWWLKNDTMVDIGRLRFENMMQYYIQPKLEKILNQKDLQAAQALGTLIKKNGQNFQAQYRNIRLKDQKFGLDQTTGDPTITESKGYSFFDALPEYFLPEHGGWDITIKGTEDIPLSKPLGQQKADEMYDRLIKNPAIDPGKLGAFLLKTRDLDPDDFSKGPPPGQGQQNPLQGPGLQKIIDLAGIENSEMMKGNEVKPTPFAPVVHTEVHINFMQSEQFKKEASQQVLQIFSNHVLGEVTAQHAREQGGQGTSPNLPGGNPALGGGQPLPGGAGGSPQSSGADTGATMNQVLPGMVQGGADTQNVSGAQSQ